MNAAGLLFGVILVCVAATVSVSSGQGNVFDGHAALENPAQQLTNGIPLASQENEITLLNPAASSHNLRP